MSRVLVLQEDPDLGSLFRMLAEHEGHLVDVVRTLDELETVLPGTSPDLVLAELPVRGSERQSLCAFRERLRDAAPGARAILCTSIPNLTRTSCVIARFEGYLEMPFDVGDAVEEMRRVLESAPFPPIRSTLA